MPPKRSAASTSKAAKVAPTANGVSPKSKSKTTAHTTAKRADQSSVPNEMKAQKKRKAEDDVEDEPKINGIKRSRGKSTTPVSPPTKRRFAAEGAKKPAEKRPRKKVIINTAPTQKLNIYVFGEGSSGELGLGSGKGQTEVKRPRLNPILDADKVGVVHLSVGGMHTAALTHDNKILTWGVNDQGALGRDTNWDGGLRDIDDDKSDDDSDSDDDTAVNPKESTPSEVDVSALPKDTVFTQLACTDSATFALTEDGLVYGWGTFRVGLMCLSERAELIKI